jgi:hypothetical protein
MDRPGPAGSGRRANGSRSAPGKHAHPDQRGNRFSDCTSRCKEPRVRAPKRIKHAFTDETGQPTAKDRASDGSGIQRSNGRRRGNAGRDGTLEFGSLGDGTPPRTHSNGHRARRIAPTAVTCRAAPAVRTVPSFSTDGCRHDGGVIRDTRGVVSGTGPSPTEGEGFPALLSRGTPGQPLRREPLHPLPAPP